MDSNRSPRDGDVVFLAADGEGFTYVDNLIGRENDDRYEIIDPSGEAFWVRRVTERDDELRAALHDNGKRVAWVVITPE